MFSPQIRSTQQSAGSIDDIQAAERWASLRQALGACCWPQTSLTPPSGSERARLHEAAQRALTVYPGPVGQLVHREIHAFLDFGHQFAQTNLITRLAEDILTSTDEEK
jgi:hypothetical protein